MASLYAIAAVSETIRGILFDARPQPEFSGAQVEICQVHDFQKSSKPIEEGVTILLYRTAVSAQPRVFSAELDSMGNRKVPPLPVDLYFSLSVWGKTALKQQRLLGWMMRLLEDMTTISASLLNYYGRPDKTFDDDETVTLIYDPVALTDMSNLWDMLKPNVQLSVTYVARMIYLESTQQPEVGAPVQTRAFEAERVLR